MNVSDPLAIYRKNIKMKKQLQNKKIHKQSVKTLNNKNDKNRYVTKNNSPAGLDFKIVLAILFAILMLIIIGFSEV